MSGIFISYRRSDTERSANLIYDHLGSRFGYDKVFIDVYGIDLGVDFHEILAEKLGRCDVLLAVIGPEWLSSAAADGTRRIDGTGDYVRIEIAAALDRKVRVVPVFVENAADLNAGDLPFDIQALAKHNGVRLRPDELQGDIERLSNGLSEVMAASERAAQSSLPPDPFATFRSEFTTEKVRHQLGGTWTSKPYGPEKD